MEREYHERFSGAIERWLDAGHGSCILRRHDCADIVAMALRYFDGKRVAIISSVVMPNHVHAVFVQNDGVASGEVAAQLEKLQLAQNELAVETRREPVAAGLFRSTSSR